MRTWWYSRVLGEGSISEDTSTDGQLLDAWRSGDRDAGNELVRRHTPALYRFFSRRAEDSVADLTQRTFLACVERRDRLPAEISFRAYLLGIARKKLLHHYRKKEREGRAMAVERESPLDSIRSPSGRAAAQEQQRLLLTALRTLPGELQMTIELYYWEGLRLAEIGRVFEIPEGTVKSRLTRARELLRKGISDAAADPALRQSTLDDLDQWAASLREPDPN